MSTAQQDAERAGELAALREAVQDLVAGSGGIAAARRRLDEVHSAIGPVLRRMAAIEPRLTGYRPRLAEALDKFDDGESAWLASPLMDSYHTVWMQLHQELILMLGLTRADDEAREERLVSGRT